MSVWNHSICERCWIERYIVTSADGWEVRRPVMMKDSLGDICCYCGQPTIIGIYIRDNPEKTQCKGKHGKEIT